MRLNVNRDARKLLREIVRAHAEREKTPQTGWTIWGTSDIFLHLVNPRVLWPACVNFPN